MSSYPRWLLSRILWDNEERKTKQWVNNVRNGEGGDVRKNHHSGLSSTGSRYRVKIPPLNFNTSQVYVHSIPKSSSISSSHVILNLPGTIVTS